MISEVNGARGGAPLTGAMQGPGGKLGKEEFLKILVAQLSHQDPLNPMQGEEFAAQLAQFSSVEQLIGLNESIRGQSAFQEAMVQGLNSSAAMSALGRTVLAVGDQVVLSGAGTEQVTFAVDGTGGAATLKLFDASGREVGTRSLGSLSGGRHTVDLGSAATGLPAGAYSYAVEVVDPSGSPVQTQTFTVARIDGVRYGPDGPVLTSGTLSIPFGAILEIFASS